MTDSSKDLETIERTFVAFKPDAVQRGIVGEILQRLERAGLKIVAMKMVKASNDLLHEHYSEHKGKDFFENLIDFMGDGPVIAGVLEGVKAVSVVRKLVGATEPYEAAAGTIRGDYAHVSVEHSNKKDKAVKNLIHASGNLEEAEKEIGLWFSDDEIYTYNRADKAHLM
ncbi:hypothetical protein AKJ56_00280 [candidate division MSBL1 archaeon SCGC-AAA382N08]|uniref:Nucleoside diphosphate kinase n=1 Tax=candidate division MSBL1 archaeon SCGC-AAA382N08 TaxID=1698285 RepID=A0A133VQU8_9EURY|nr:hypothetical protein AKJ56_00280 [candidate division MSBL1 archaeon SCGC-AAA382N08]